MPVRAILARPERPEVAEPVDDDGVVVPRGNHARRAGVQRLDALRVAVPVRELLLGDLREGRGVSD